VRDPHIARLHFEIGSEEGSSYENPEPVSFENSLGRFDARDAKLVVEPADHFADHDASRSIIEPFLRSWEIETDLDSNPGTIRFKFLNIDEVIRLSGQARLVLRLNDARLTVSRLDLKLHFTDDA